MPFPSGLHDRFNVGKLDLPTKFSDSLGWIGVGGRNIAIAARAEFVRHFETGYLLNDLDYFENACGSAGAEIVVELGSGLVELVESGDVSSADIVDVHVIAQTGSIRGRVVCSEYDELFALSASGLNGKGYEVGFRLMVFADGSVWSGARSVEVAKAGI